MEEQAFLERYKWVIMAVTALGIFAALAYVMLDQREPTSITINPPLPTATASASPVPSATSTPSPLQIYITGAVASPNTLLSLPAGARVEDALSAAGGALDTADLSVVNLAQILRDGDQIHVPSLDSQVANPRPSPNAPLLININTASQAELESLPNIGEKTALAIIEYREANGPFETVDALTEVSGIGERTLENLRPLISVGD